MTTLLTNQLTVSLVIPIYNEIGILDALTERIGQLIGELGDYRWEVIYVNDGSKDGSTEKMSELAEAHSWLSSMHLSRNFGHQIAISAGIDYACGDAVIVMDGDLQDPPELIIGMLEKWREGFDVVYATRKSREGETPFKLFTASLFYRLLNKYSEIPIPLDTGDFRLMSRPVVNALSHMRERNRFIRGLVSWIGFKQTPIYYERDKRVEGETKYTLIKMMKFAVDGLLSFSKVPLQLITQLGLFIAGVSFLTILTVIYMTLFTDIPVVRGWASLMIMTMLLGGVQLVCIGVIGEYVGRIFDESRGRPMYLIRNIDTPVSFRLAPTEHQAHLNSINNENNIHVNPKPLNRPQTEEIVLHEYTHAGS